MATDNRRNFIIKWTQRGKEADDPFDKFFSLWIALIVASQQVMSRLRILSDGITDREKIIEYLKSESSKIKNILNSNYEIMVKLSTRKGTKYSNPIVDTGSSNLRDKFQSLSNYFILKEKLDDDKLAEIIGELINKIRNNLFHGNKLYDNMNDIGLLNLINPILLQILENYESLLNK